MSRPDLEDLRTLMARLRAPDGCPWDREQTLGSLRAYLLEEAHEVAAAIDGGDWDELRDELGDLLFQIVFEARLAEEAGAFALPDVVAGIYRKMVERHPHVFGDPGERLADATAVAGAWERRKRAQRPAEHSILAGVAGSLPALLAAYRMTQKAAGVGFDWADAAAVLDKVEEEIAELRTALAAAEREPGPAPAAVAEELGDLLFTIANLGRKLEVDPEAALAATNRKFRRRFGHIEQRLAAAGRSLDGVPLRELDALWEEAKRELEPDR